MSNLVGSGKHGPEVVVFCFYDKARNEVLLERRLPTSSFANLEIYPGGGVEPDELDKLEKDYIRI